MTTTLKLVLVGLLASAAGTTVAQAEPAGVAALVNQGKYWQGRGRPDLANQAFRRALQLDPNNAIARAALSGANAKPKAPVPVAAKQAPKPAAQPKVAQPAAKAPATAIAAPAPRAAPADRGGDARAAGFKALNGGDVARADMLFQSALQRNRNDADATGGLGLVRLRQDRFAEARDLLERASQRGSAGKWAEALGSARFYAGVREAQAAADAGRLSDAQQIAEGLVASDFAQKQPAYDLLAGVYERQGRYAEAARLYGQATASGKPGASQNGNAIRAQALDAAQSGNDAQAEQLFQRGLMADASDPWIRYEFARFLESKGRRADADGVVGSLRNSSNVEALYAAALFSSQTDRPMDAEALLDRIPASGRTEEMRALGLTLKTEAAVARAKAMAAQGQGGQALSALRQLAATPNLSTGSQGALAQALYDMGDEASATQVAQQALSTDGGDAASMEPIVRVLAKAGQDAFAQAAVQRAAERAGATPDGQRTVAKLNGILAASQADRLRESGQYAPAFDLLQAQWSASPGNLDVLSALARLYQSGGMSVQAAQTYQMVLNQSPKDVGATIGMVDAASGAGDFASAQAALDRAITLAPADYNVYLAGARMEQARGDERDAKRYLAKARELYLGKTMPSGGGFMPTNPFAGRGAVAGGNPFAPQQPVNPFALGTEKQPSRQQQAFAVPMSAPSMFARNTATPFGGAPLANDASSMGGPITDPVLASIDRDMRALAEESGPRVEVQTGFRDRSGETGLSSLSELTGDAEISTDLAGGRVSAKASAVVLDAGRPTGSGLARFGAYNPIAEAVGIVAEQPSPLAAADSQTASGVALSVAYRDKTVQADIGSTPLGFEKTQIQGGLSITPHLSRYSTVRIWGERRPVTDSVLAYAGTRDPLFGMFWGAVMKNGGGLSYSYDRDGSGIYADASYFHYDGYHTLSNDSIQVNVGGYLRAYRDASSTLTVGVNANYQDYDNNQNFFTFGHGGYFSPQSFMSVSFPVRYSYRTNQLEVGANIVPGYQSYSQDSAALLPLDAAGQGALDALKLLNSDVRARFDSESKTGFGINAGGSAYYSLGDGTRIGGELNVNTFGQYNEFRSLLGIRRQIGGGQ